VTGTSVDVDDVVVVAIVEVEVVGIEVDVDVEDVDVVAPGCDVLVDVVPPREVDVVVAWSDVELVVGTSDVDEVVGPIVLDGPDVVEVVGTTTVELVDVELLVDVEVLEVVDEEVDDVVLVVVVVTGHWTPQHARRLFCLITGGGLTIPVITGALDRYVSSFTSEAVSLPAMVRPALAVRMLEPDGLPPSPVALSSPVGVMSI